MSACEHRRCGAMAERWMRPGAVNASAVAASAAAARRVVAGRAVGIRTFSVICSSDERCGRFTE